MDVGNILDGFMRWTSYAIFDRKKRQKASLSFEQKKALKTQMNGSECKYVII